MKNVTISMHFWIGNRSNQAQHLVDELASSFDLIWFYFGIWSRHPISVRDHILSVHFSSNSDCRFFWVFPWAIDIPPIPHSDAFANVILLLRLFMPPDIILKCESISGLLILLRCQLDAVFFLSSSSRHSVCSKLPSIYGNWSHCVYQVD